jgi:TPR repeat protein
MPSINSLSTNNDPGTLRLPPLDNPPVPASAAALAREINDKGVYIHKVHRSVPYPAIDSAVIRSQLAKVIDREDKIPTPATFVGVGFHKTYNNRGWTNTSGLVFSPAAASVLSYKGDIHSYRLSRAKKFSGNAADDPNFDYTQYARYLSDRFNELGPTLSLINNRKEVPLKLREDVVLAREKYAELALRGNLHFRKQQPSDSIIKDVSSKFLVARLANAIKPAEQWKKTDLLTFLTAIDHVEKKRIDTLLAHARLKINRFDGDAQVVKYLQKGSVAPVKENHYSKMVGEWGSLPPNEHLLMPAPRDVVGVLVNLDCVAGIDHALEINQQVALLPGNRFDAKHGPLMMTYRLSHKVRQSIDIVDRQQVALWSSKELIAFAKSGLATAGSRPDHFHLLHTIAHASALVGLQKDTIGNQTHGVRQFVDDLSMINEGGKNLFQLLIEQRDDPHVIADARFFCMWNVPPREADKADDALRTAERLQHRALPLLKEAATWNADIRSNLRQRHIREQLSRIQLNHAREATYALRNGIVETGKAEFISELQTYRVTRGRHCVDEMPIPRYEGVYVYDADLDDMAMVVGQRRDHGGLQQLGLWRAGTDSASPPDNLHLGVRYLRGQPGPNGIAKDVILIASNVAGSEMRIALRPNGTTASGHSVRFEMMSSTGTTQLNDFDVDTDRCTSFKMTCYVIKTHYDEFLDGIRAGKMFNHVAVTRSRFHGTQFKKPERAINIVRYTLANLRYLSAWQVASGEDSPYDSEAVAFMKNNSDDTTKCIRHRISMSLIDMRDALTEQLASTRPLLAKTDAGGKCLYDHLTCLIDSFKEGSFSSDVEEDATLQFLLGKICADGLVHREPHHDNARHFFEKGLLHRHAQSQLALGHMHAHGLGGLSANMNRALELYQLSAAQGNADAITALHDAAQRLARERVEVAEQLEQARQQTSALKAAAITVAAELAAASAAAAAPRPRKRSLVRSIFRR